MKNLVLLSIIVTSLFSCSKTPKDNTLGLQQKAITSSIHTLEQTNKTLLSMLKWLMETDEFHLRAGGELLSQVSQFEETIIQLSSAYHGDSDTANRFLNEYKEWIMSLNGRSENNLIPPYDKHIY